MDKIAICNLALHIAGMSDRIESETEDSLERRVCFDWFDFSVREILSAFQWRFAEKYADVQSVASDRHDYPWLVTLPDDCLNVRSLYNDFGVIHRWKMSGDQKKALSMSPASSCEYTADIEVDLWPYKHIELLATSLAVRIAPPLLRTADSAAQPMQLYQLRLNSAMMEEASAVRDYVNNNRRHHTD